MNTSDDQDDAGLLSPLRDIDAVDGPPPRYDVAAAMRQAEMIRRRRASVGALVAVAVTAVAIGVPVGLRPGAQTRPAPSASVSGSAPTSTPPLVPDITSPDELPVANCTVTTLTAPAAAGAFNSWAGGVLDPTGRYLGAPLIKPFTTPLSGYLPGKALLMDLRTGHTSLIPVTDAGVSGVNASGVVIGTSGPKYAGWVYRNGTVTSLPRYHGVVAAPVAINGHGDIVGQVRIGTTETSVIWPADHPGTVRALAPTGMLATTISDTGTIGGSYQNRPWVDDANGAGHALATGAQDARGGVYEIRGDYAVGWGLSETRQGIVPMVWNLHTGPRTQYAYVVLGAIASDGTVVGDVSIGSSRYGLIGRGGVLRRLPSGATGNPPVVVNDIIADGHTIVGRRNTSTNTDGPISEVGLLWHC